MGCDIHIYTEEKYSNENDWWCIDNWELDYWARDSDDSESKYSHREWYSGRDYYLFGLLSQGVRNDNPYGFPARGIPSDVSDMVKKEYESWGRDAHSASWVTLEELRIRATHMAIVKDPLMYTNTKENSLVSFIKEFDQFLKSIKWPHQLENQMESKWRIIYWFDN